MATSRDAAELLDAWTGWHAISPPMKPMYERYVELANKGAEQDILLGPGHLFSPDLQPSNWFRFNVAFCDEPAVFAFLQSQRHRA